jgi:hypothetical protein
MDEYDRVINIIPQGPKSLITITMATVITIHAFRNIIPNA